jgi:2-polyprenyl-3-methyl-5-hydroxy-6-metoxy-1,4-benzoquinol methylase
MAHPEHRYSDDDHAENGGAGGNAFPKYTTRNPIARRLVAGFLRNLDSLVNQVQPASIHEVGCGEGYLISRYSDGRRLLTASDNSARVISEARRLHGAPGIRFKTSNLFDLDPDEDSASLILCCEVLEHVRPAEAAIDALAMLARPFLIASVPNEPQWRILNLIRGSYLPDLGNTPGHLNHWSRTQFLRLIGRRFEILRIRQPTPWTMVLCRAR